MKGNKALNRYVTWNETVLFLRAPVDDPEGPVRGQTGRHLLLLLMIMDKCKFEKNVIDIIIYQNNSRSDCCRSF